MNFGQWGWEGHLIIINIINCVDLPSFLPKKNILPTIFVFRHSLLLFCGTDFFGQRIWFIKKILNYAESAIRNF
jgi:hypothetical protein